MLIIIKVNLNNKRHSERWLYWYIRIYNSIPSLPTVFSVKCEIFCPYSLNFRRFTDSFQRLSKFSKEFQRSLKTSRRLLKITKGVERFLTTSKQGTPMIFKGFSTNLEIIKEFRRCSNDFSNIFKYLHSLLSVRHEKLVWMREITILDPQAWIRPILRLLKSSEDVLTTSQTFLSIYTRYCQLGMRNWSECVRSQF